MTAYRGSAYAIPARYPAEPARPHAHRRADDDAADGVPDQSVGTGLGSGGQQHLQVVHRLLEVVRLGRRRVALPEARAGVGAGPSRLGFTSVPGGWGTEPVHVLTGDVISGSTVVA